MLYGCSIHFFCARAFVFPPKRRRVCVCVVLGHQSDVAEAQRLCADAHKTDHTTFSRQAALYTLTQNATHLTGHCSSAAANLCSRTNATYNIYTTYIVCVAFLGKICSVNVLVRFVRARARFVFSYVVPVKSVHGFVVVRWFDRGVFSFRRDAGAARLSVTSNN